MKINRKKIVADEEITVEEPVVEEGAAEVEVAPEATELLFEVEDVAEIIAEATGEAVEVEAEDDVVTFTVGDQVITAEAEGSEEILEASKKVLKNKKAVAASRKIAPKRRVVRK